MGSFDSEQQKIAFILMTASRAHHQAFLACADHSGRVKQDNIDRILVRIVSLELLLLSIEQSLKLMLYWHDRVIRTTHDILKLYERTKRAAQSRIGGWGVVIGRANQAAEENNMPQITDRDIGDLIDRYKSLYSVIRYGMDLCGKSVNWSIVNREFNMLACFSVGLLRTNVKLLDAEGVEHSGRLRRVPDSEITPDLQRIVDDLRARNK